MKKEKNNLLFSKLTNRQSEIALLLIEGFKTSSIASELNIKSNTVSTIKKQIFKKVGVDDAIQLYKLAQKEGQTNS